MKIYGVILAVLLAVGALGRQFVAPQPPSRIVVAAGPEGGASLEVARRWVGHLARDGIQLEVLATAGSVENPERVGGVQPRADIALVQGGVSGEAARPGLRSLGAIAYEAVWVFLRADHPAGRLRDL